VSVKEEVELLEDYMALQLMRFQGCIAFENTISGKALNGKLPYFSLITLAENAIKHNQCTAKNPLQIALYNDGDFIYLKNKIQKKQTSLPSTGIGLKNLRERYQLLYQVNLNVQEDEEYFVVQLKWIDGEDHSH
jgi:LytS/YehU family sensor histidine kinase